MINQASTIHSYIGPRKEQFQLPADVKKLVKDLSNEDYRSLIKFGIGLDSNSIAEISGFGMDSLNGSLSTPSVSLPIQFAQVWLPGLIKYLTAIRQIDELVGITVIGDWEDEEIVATVLEHSGAAQTYGDYNNIPFSSWNTNFERRTIVQFEQGAQTGKMEAARSAKMNVSTDVEKREAAHETLEIIRNKIGFFGFNNGANRTYGFLNDPNLPAYITVPNSKTGSPLWANKDFNEIVTDIRTAATALRTQSKGQVDPMRDNTTLSLPVAAADYLTVPNSIGTQTIREWISANYPNMRIVIVPEQDTANGGVGVFYLYAEQLRGNSTDNGQVFDQFVPAKVFLVGTEVKAKTIVEDWSNATAGVMCKRPIGVVRYSGIV